MKYIKKFESKKSKHSYRNITEDEFTEISDTLQGEIFDDYGIVYLSDDDYDSYDMDNGYKYWKFSYDDRGNMRQINICHLDKRSMNKIAKKLEELKPTIKGRVGVDYDIRLCNDKYDSEQDYYIVIFPEK